MKIFFMVVTAIAMQVNVCKAQDQAGGRDVVESLFNSAVEAEGDDYFELRERILQYDEIAIPFLLKASDDERLHARVVARALLAWVAQPATENGRTSSMKFLDEALNSAAHGGNLMAAMYALSDQDRHRINLQYERFHAHERVAFDVSSALRYRGGIEWVLIGRMVPHRIKSMDQHDVFLLESALKGFPPQWRERIFSRPPDYVNHLGRGYAAALSGGYPCQDTFPLLVELLKTDESWCVRMGAARGLEIIGDMAVVVPPLLEALKDESEDVRGNAHLALRNLSGDDLSMDPARRWVVGSEQIDAAEKWWADNKDRILKEQLESDTSPNTD